MRKHGDEIMNKGLMIGLVAIFIVGIASLGLVLAYKGNPSVQGPNYNADIHEQLETAIEARDYDAWVQIRTDNNLPMHGRMFQVINEDNFDLYAELHEANELGDSERAAEIRAELGLGQGMQGKGGCQRALESGSAGGCPMAGSCGGGCNR